MSVQAGERTVVVSLAGEIDMRNEQLLRQALHKAIDECAAPRLEIDLGQVTFFAAAGGRVLVSAYHRAHAAGIQVVVVARSPMLVQILKIVADDVPVRSELEPLPVEPRPRILPTG